MGERLELADFTLAWFMYVTRVIVCAHVWQGHGDHVNDQ